MFPRARFKADEWNDTTGESTGNLMALEAPLKGDVRPPELDVGLPEPGQNDTTEMEGAPEDNVEADMSKFAESSVHMFPESGVAAFFLIACLVWLAVMVFAGSAHHGSVWVTDDARTGRSKPDDEHRYAPMHRGRRCFTSRKGCVPLLRQTPMGRQRTGITYART